MKQHREKSVAEILISMQEQGFHKERLRNARPMLFTRKEPKKLAKEYTRDNKIKCLYSAEYQKEDVEDEDAEVPKKGGFAEREAKRKAAAAETEKKRLATAKP